ncbi:MAG: type III-B CRISPR module-associated Cmr3 family protein [Bacteroidota bacterium]
MSKIYCVRLIPLNGFFFGGERNFVTDGEKNYLVQSRKFPQQTTLLGMLRQEILIQQGVSKMEEGKQSESAKEWAKLIGPKSFQLNPNKQKQAFGWIKAISPAYMFREDHLYQILPKDDGLEFQTRKKIKVDLGFGIKSVPLLKKLNPKHELVEAYQSVDQLIPFHGDSTNGEQGVWIASQSIGIHKRYEGGTYDDAFFKQTSFWPNGKEAGFQFYVNMKEEAQLESNIVYMGGERSAFQMEIEEVSYPQFDPFIAWEEDRPARKNEVLRVVLQAHSFVNPDELYPLCRHVFGQTISFRSLETNLFKTKSYNRIAFSKDNPSGARTRSALYHLLEKGSVLYVQQPHLASVKRALSHPQFIQIGYNYCQINLA